MGVGFTWGPAIFGDLIGPGSENVDGWLREGLTSWVPKVSCCAPCLSQIVVSLVNGRPGAMNFTYSPLLRNFTKATNIRLRFLRTNTLLGHLMGKALRDPTVTRRVSCSWPSLDLWEEWLWEVLGGDVSK